MRTKYKKKSKDSFRSYLAKVVFCVNWAVFMAFKREEQQPS